MSTDPAEPGGPPPAPGLGPVPRWLGSLRIPGERALEPAALVGLLVQAALAIALLLFWFRDGPPFFLPSLGGVGTALYVAQLVAWPVGFLFVLGGYRLPALAFLVGAALASAIVLVFEVGLGGDLRLWRVTLGMIMFGIVPLACLLLSPRAQQGVGRRRVPVWLAALVVLALVLIFGGPRLPTFLPGSPFLPGKANELPSLLSQLWHVGLLAGLALWWMDPRLSLAGAVLSIPFVVLGPYAAASGIDLVGGAVLLLVLSVIGFQRLHPDPEALPLEVGNV